MGWSTKARSRALAEFGRKGAASVSSFMGEILLVGGRDNSGRAIAALQAHAGRSY